MKLPSKELLSEVLGIDVNEVKALKQIHLFVDVFILMGGIR